MGYRLNTENCRRVFERFLSPGEHTNGDEVLVDLNEPQGEKISFISAGHNSDKCKAFAATTTKGRVLIAVFNIWGDFHKCYCCDKVREVSDRKVFGGSEIAFAASSQYGEIKTKIYVANKQFGTDWKQQKEHVVIMINNLRKIEKSGECIQYPVSELIRNAKQFIDFFGRLQYEPIAMQVACYKGKEYLFFAEDVSTKTAILYTGDIQSIYEGFVHESDVSTCTRIGKYDGTSQGLILPVVINKRGLPKGAYCREVAMKDIEYIYHRRIYAMYRGCKLELKDIMVDRVTLCFKEGEGDGDKGYAEVLKDAGFETVIKNGEHMWMPDERMFIKRDVPYNMPGVEFFVRKHYCANEKEDEISRFDFCCN